MGFALDLDNRTNVQTQGNTYNTGLWNPNLRGRDSEGSFGIMPSITNVTTSGFTYGVNYDLWALIVRRNADQAGTGIKLEGSIEGRAAYGYNKNNKRILEWTKDANASLRFDSGKIGIFNFGRGVSGWTGDRVEVRAAFTGEIGNSNDVTRLGLPIASFSMGLSKPLEKLFTWRVFGCDVNPMKSLNYTIAYSANRPFGAHNGARVLDSTANTYGYMANSNLWGKVEAVGTSFGVDHSFYYKHKLNSHQYRPFVNLADGREERWRLGASLSVASWTLMGEGYDAASAYRGDRYGGKWDYDVYLGGRLKRWQGKGTHANESLDLNIGVGSTEIGTYLRKGFNHPPIKVQIDISGIVGRLRVFGNFNATIKGKKTRKGVYEDFERKTMSATAHWDGISAYENGGPFQASKIVTVTSEHPIAFYSGKPSVKIGGGNLQYETRNLIPGQRGTDAVGNWQSGSYITREALFIKRVKLIDKAHGISYGLNANGKFVPLTGDHPTTAPDLTEAKYFLGQDHNFNLPAEMYNTDGIIFYDMIVEYGADTGKITQKEAMIIYNEDGTERSNPNDDLQHVYDYHVRWPGYYDTDMDRQEVDPYDLTQPYGPSNMYYLGLVRLAPVALNVSENF